MSVKQTRIARHGLLLIMLFLLVAPGSFFARDSSPVSAAPHPEVNYQSLPDPRMPSACPGKEFQPQKYFADQPPLNNPSVWQEDASLPGHWSTYQYPQSGFPFVVLPKGVSGDVVIYDGPNAHVDFSNARDALGRGYIPLTEQGGEIEVWCPVR